MLSGADRDQSASYGRSPTCIKAPLALEKSFPKRLPDGERFSDCPGPPEEGLLKGEVLHLSGGAVDGPIGQIVGDEAECTYEQGPASEKQPESSNQLSGSPTGQVQKAGHTAWLVDRSWQLAGKQSGERQNKKAESTKSPGQLNGYSHRCYAPTVIRSTVPYPLAQFIPLSIGGLAPSTRRLSARPVRVGAAATLPLR